MKKHMNLKWAIMPALALTMFATSCSKDEITDKDGTNLEMTNEDGKLSIDEFYNRPYNETTFLMTHNSYNTVEDSLWLPNQRKNIYQQLQDGVRGFMIDVHQSEGELYVMHNRILSPILGKMPLSDQLNMIKTFMKEDANAIVTIIYENHVRPSRVIEEMKKCGLADMIFAQDPNLPWPTLSDMIKNNKRIVVFCEDNVGEPNDKEGKWSVAWNRMMDTSYSFHRPSDLLEDTGVINRGNGGTHELFLLNHFATIPYTGVGSRLFALKDNIAANVYDHVKQVQKTNGQRVNFIGVDFYDLPSARNLLMTIDLLNHEDI